jgi:hypothetical protein
MDQDRADYADPEPRPPGRWVRGLAVLLAVLVLFGLGIGGARLFYAVRDHFLR